MIGKYLEISPPVRAALNAGITVVALESGSFCARPYPENLRCMQELEQAVWQQNCIPAYLALINGQIRVGLTPAQEDALMRSGAVCARGELAAAAARGQSASLLPSAALAAAALAELETLIVPVLRDEVADLDALALCGRMVLCAALPESARALYAARSVPVAEDAIAAQVWLMQRALAAPESVVCPAGHSAVSLAAAACRVAIEIRKRIEYDSRQRPGETRADTPPLCVTCPTALELRRRIAEEEERERAAQAEQAEEEAGDIYEEYKERFPVDYPQEETGPEEPADPPDVPEE